jgi:hypothetical protein
VVYAFARDPAAGATEPRVGLTVSRKVGGAVDEKLDWLEAELRELAGRASGGAA